jgi:cell division protein FtsQ
VTATVSRRPRIADSDGTGRRGWSRRTVLVIVAVAVLLVATATWVVAFSPLLGVRTVSVRGEQAVTQQQIVAAADIAHGTPLVRLDTAAAARRVEAIEGIYTARVSTSFPSTVVISVVERTPVGVVKHDHRYVLVDRTGDQYRTVDSEPPHLPVFVVPVGTDSRTTGGAVATVAAALTAPLRARIASIQALDPNAITLLLTDGRVVAWGSVDRSSEKARILPILLRQKGHQFDVTDPTRPFSR